MLSFRSETSPFASTVIDRVRSPWVTAVDTSAIARTCVVSEPAMLFTFSVRSRHTPDTPSTSRLAAELALRSHLARDARDLGRERRELVDHRVDRVLELEDLAAHFDGDLLRRSPFATAVVTSAMLRTCG